MTHPATSPNAVIDTVIDAVIAPLARELAAEGALAVLLFGSFARGDATPYSDLDLWALGSGLPRYEMRGGRLVVVSWVMPEEARAQFSDPAAACQGAAAWRDARILYDPHGCAADIQRAAREWTWDALDSAACDARVAREMAGFAEEVLKLASALQYHHATMAAVQRDVLALRLAGIMALHHRLLYNTENRLWDILAESLGDPWASVQARALGLTSPSFEDSCRAALELYALAARAARDLFTETQRAIVRHACTLAGYPIE